jgi:hypothetical protein
MNKKLINKDILVINTFISKVIMFNIFICYITIKFSQQNLFHEFWTNF